MQYLSAPGQLPNQITGSRKPRIWSRGNSQVLFYGLHLDHCRWGGGVGVPRWADPGREEQGPNPWGQLCPLVNKKGVQECTGPA